MMSNEKIIDVDDTYDKEKLGLFFDPYIYIMNLNHFVHTELKLID